MPPPGSGRAPRAGRPAGGFGSCRSLIVPQPGAEAPHCSALAPHCPAAGRPLARAVRAAALHCSAEPGQLWGGCGAVCCDNSAALSFRSVPMRGDESSPVRERRVNATRGSGTPRAPSPEPAPRGPGRPLPPFRRASTAPRRSTGWTLRRGARRTRPRRLPKQTRTWKEIDADDV